MSNYFKEWYEGNKEEYNKKRRERYKKDKKFREACIVRSKEYRRKQRNQDIGRGYMTRMFKKKEVVVVPISEAAQIVGRSVQTIRLWERRRLIPRPLFPDFHRLYTEHQVELLIFVAEELSKVGELPTEKAKAHIKYIKERVRQGWKQVAEVNTNG